MLYFPFSEATPLTPRPVWPPRLISATTTTASILAPRLIVKLPAIGQDSMRAVNVAGAGAAAGKQASFGVNQSVNSIRSL